MCHLYLNSKLRYAGCPNSSITLKHELPGYKKAFEGFLCIDIIQSLEQTCSPLCSHTPHFVLQWVVFCWAIIPQGQQDYRM